MRHKTWGRFSFIGSDPFLVLKSKGKTIVLEQRGKITRKKGNPLEELRNILNTYKIRPNPKNPLPFMGGGVGYPSFCIQVYPCPVTASLQRNEDAARVPMPPLTFSQTSAIIPSCLFSNKNQGGHQWVHSNQRFW